MLVQIISRFGSFYEFSQAWTVQISTYVRKHIKQFVQKHYRKVSAFSLVFKLISVTLLLGVMPLNTGKVNTNQTAVKLDTSNPFVLTNQDRQISITAGESNFDAQSKIAQGRKSNRIAYAAPVQRDASYFKSLYQSAASEYGIPWEVLAAVHYVESGMSDSTNRSSYAGAQGPMQFMPGTWRAYAVDGDGDGSADITNVNDAVYGAANLLAAGGAAEGNVDAALYNYNHAQWYVDKVNEVAGSIQ